MRYLNVLIVIIVGLFGYGFTLYMDQTSEISVKVIEAPVSVARDMDKSSAPDFSFKDIKGRQGSLSDFKGRVVLLNFWASWCPPCVKEFPDDLLYL